MRYQATFAGLLVAALAGAGVTANGVHDDTVTIVGRRDVSDGNAPDHRLAALAVRATKKKDDDPVPIDYTQPGALPAGYWWGRCQRGMYPPAHIDGIGRRWAQSCDKEEPWIPGTWYDCLKGPDENKSKKKNRAARQKLATREPKAKDADKDPVPIDYTQPGALPAGYSWGRCQRGLYPPAHIDDVGASRKRSLGRSCGIDDSGPKEEPWIPGTWYDCLKGPDENKSKATKHPRGIDILAIDAGLMDTRPGGRPSHD